MPKVDIVIPVYNEDKNIIKLIDNLKKNLNHTFRILICYDDKSDTTLNILKKEKVENEVTFVKNPNQGPNSAILEGINYSTAKIILIYMADDFENIELINKMVELIDSGYDLVIPSRFILGGEMLGAKKIKKFVTIMGSHLLYYIGGLPFKDCTNAFKMFSSNLKTKINFESTKGFTFATELTIKSHLLKSRIIEIPSVWRETKNRKSNFKMIKWIPYYIYWLFYAVITNFVLKLKNLIKF